MSSLSDTRSLHDSFQEMMRSDGSCSNMEPLFNELFEIEKAKLTGATKVYDMRWAERSFVRGEMVFHSCKDAKSLRNFIQRKYQATCVLIEPNERMGSCVIINMDQMTNEIQLFVSIPFDNDEEMHDSHAFPNGVKVLVAKCISVARDSCVSFLFDKYSHNQEEVDSMFCSNRPSLVRRAQASVTSLQYLSTFDKLHFYQDCPQSLRIVHIIDEQREIVFYLPCLKCDNVRDIQEKLASKFSEIQCQLDDKKCMWITDSTNVLKPSDYIFLQEIGFDGSLFVHISDLDSLPVKFLFRNKSIVVILPKDATVKELREQAGKMLHKPANSLKVSCNKEKCEDSKPIVDIGHNQTPFVVELAAEKTLTFTMVHHGETSSDKIEIKVYKMDTISDVKRKLTSVVGVDPFYIKLVLNASFLDDEATIHSSRIQSGDFLEIIICPNRVKITLRYKKGQHSLVVDDIMKTTISDLKNFCGHELQCNPENISIFFKGYVLFNNARSLFDEGVVYGSLLFAMITCQDNIQNRELITLYVEGCEEGIRSQKAIKYRGKIIPVPESHQFDDPDPATQIMQLPIPKGIRIVKSDKSTYANATYKMQKGQITSNFDGNSSMMQESYHPERKDITNAPSSKTVPMTSSDSEASEVISTMDLSTTTLNMNSTNPSNIASALIALNKENISSNLETAPSTMTVARRSVSPSANISSTAALQTCNDIQSGHMLCTEVHRVYKSPTGGIVSSEKTQLVQYGSPNQLQGLHHSLSDSVLSCHDSSYVARTPRPMVLHLENAVPEKLLNALADELGQNWNDLALALEISWNDVQTITHNEPRDLKRQALTMLHKWQLANGTNATIEVLCKALKSCQLVLIAEKIQQSSESF